MSMLLYRIIKLFNTYKIYGFNATSRRIFNFFKNKIPILDARRRLSFKYLTHGTGIEVGGLHNPLSVRDNVKVSYVDYETKERNQSRFLELAGKRIVHTDIVDNGLVLSKVPDGSIDFLVANHVLEHSPNIHQTMLIWASKLKENGTLFITVPVADQCFDRGRPITDLEHIYNDFEIHMNNDKNSILKATRDHLYEWFSISHVNSVRENGCAPLNIDQKWNASQVDMCMNKFEKAIHEKNLQNIADAYTLSNTDIHFHTFSKNSFSTYLKSFVQYTNKKYKIMEIAGNGAEIISVIQRI